MLASSLRLLATQPATPTDQSQEEEEHEQLNNAFTRLREGSVTNKERFFTV